MSSRSLHRLLPATVLLSLGCPGDDGGGTGTESSTDSTMTMSSSVTTTATASTGTSESTSGTSMPTSNPATSATTDPSTESESETATGSESSSGGEPNCPDTRFPGSIDGVEPESHSHHPPVLDGNGNLYRMVETPASDGNNPKMMKSEDDGATWSEVDQDNRPDATDLEGSYQVVIDSTIYFSLTRGPRVWWFAFNTSDDAGAPDTWVPDEDVDQDLTSGGVVQFSSLSQTSDGNFWIAYSDLLAGGRQQIAYRQRTGADTYGPKVSVGAASGEWTGPRLVLGADDVSHMFYKDHENNELLWRTLSAGGDLSGATRIDTDGTSNVPVPHTHAVIYESGGAEVIVLAFSGDDDTLKALTLTDGVAGAEEQISTETVLQDANVVANEGAVAHVILQGTTVHAVWTDEDTGDVLLSSRPDGGAWSAEQTIWSSEGEEALYIYCSLLRTMNCPRLACTYDVGPHEDDTGTIEYIEVILN